MNLPTSYEALGMPDEIRDKNQMNLKMLICNKMHHIFFAEVRVASQLACQLANFAKFHG